LSLSGQICSDVVINMETCKRGLERGLSTDEIEQRRRTDKPFELHEPTGQQKPRESASISHRIDARVVASELCNTQPRQVYGVEPRIARNGSGHRKRYECHANG